jgi:hypothetical protein
LISNQKEGKSRISSRRQNKANPFAKERHSFLAVADSASFFYDTKINKKIIFNPFTTAKVTF